MRSALVLGSVLVFVAIHLFVDRLKFLCGTPRSRWLSAAGGMSVAYVFLHLLPELSEGQQVLAESAGPLRGLVERHVYLIALAGLVVFYGLERMALTSRRGRRTGPPQESAPAGIFRLHIASFALYNVLIGYLLLHREGDDTASLFFFALAMALHFLVSDYGLHEHHESRYEHAGRWILSAAVVLGWLLGRFLEVDRAVVTVLIAFLGGAVILNVLKEELPQERESRFSAFLIGTAGYAALLLAV